MAGVCKLARFPALGIDCVTKLTATSAAALKAAGISFCVRYLGSLDAEELGALLGAGLAVMAVGYSRAPGWEASAEIGTSDGVAAVSHAMAAGLPPGITLWCDLEGVASDAASVTAYVNAWAVAVKHGGYDAGLYVGAGQPLDGPHLYALGVDRYWRSLSRGVPEVTCGWTMIQLYKTTEIAGVEVDVDVVQYDFGNRLPNWAEAA